MFRSTFFMIPVFLLISSCGMFAENNESQRIPQSILSNSSEVQSRVSVKLRWKNELPVDNMENFVATEIITKKGPFIKVMAPLKFGIAMAESEGHKRSPL